jgi:hypothetical protein
MSEVAFWTVAGLLGIPSLIFLLMTIIVGIIGIGECHIKCRCCRPCQRYIDRIKKGVSVLLGVKRRFLAERLVGSGLLNPSLTPTVGYSVWRFVVELFVAATHDIPVLIKVVHEARIANYPAGVCRTVWSAIIYIIGSLVLLAAMIYNAAEWSSVSSTTVITRFEAWAPLAGFLIAVFLRAVCEMLLAAREVPYAPRKVNGFRRLFGFAVASLSKVST